MVRKVLDLDLDFGIAYMLYIPATKSLIKGLLRQAFFIIFIINTSMKKLLLLLVVLFTNVTFSQTCGYLPNLFISEVTDASLGGLTYVEIYNATEESVNLSGYNLKIYNNGGLTPTSTVNLATYQLAPQSTYIVALGVVTTPTTSNTCLSVASSNGSLSNQLSLVGSINFTTAGHDCIRLFSGTTVIDSFGTYGLATWADGLGIGTKGVNFRRKGTVIVPNPTYSNSDWDIIDWVDSPTCTNDNYLDIGTHSYTIPNSTTWNGTAWSNGDPSLTKLAIINGEYNTASNGSFEACSVVVNTARTLTITDNQYVKIENNLTVNGTVNILNNGSLVQVSDSGRSIGNINISRSTIIRKTDYVYWSTPVTSFLTNQVSPLTPTSLIYKWEPTIANTNNALGNWVNGNESMVIAKGYAIRGPDTYPTTPTPFTTTFTGIPNNGIKQIDIYRGTYTGGDYVGTNGATVTNYDDNWNLIGNPYPSSISALALMTLNPSIDGGVYIWTHSTAISQTSSPFYATYVYNYTPSDYVRYNGTGTEIPGVFEGNIGSGQAFFVSMVDGPAATSTVTFNNSMRSTAGNNQFFRSNNQKSRIWVSLINSSNYTSTTLVGYVDQATYNVDRLYDTRDRIGTSMKIYSLIDDQPMVIQGRPTPFIPTDIIPIGVAINTSGTYTIAINQVDGVFSNPNRKIYLEDVTNNTTHNLSQSPYIFTSNVGTYNNRFRLKYINTNRNIESRTIYTMLGENLYQLQKAVDLDTFIREKGLGRQILIIKTKFDDGTIETTKILNSQNN